MFHYTLLLWTELLLSDRDKSHLHGVDVSNVPTLKALAHGFNNTGLDKSEGGKYVIGEV